MSSEAKLEILTRINRIGAKEAQTFERAPVHRSDRARSAVVEQFAEFAAEYRANVVRLSSGQLPQVIADRLSARGSARVIVPHDLPQGWLPAELSVSRDDHEATDLTSFQAVITAAAVGVAETGTVVLDHGAGQGRRALTLVPDHHLCVVRESQVVDSIPEAVALLQSAVQRGQPLTWISGPSATSDIELSRVEGVHGPRILDLLLVREG
ncbi:LutC/YkgG family protein [Deinococcus hohokamensis]|uniref:Lactate utilization protein C n=1 Tax=Deinococcus hohokamensis TaxID=309883 RepID=A0ABV9IFE4_9DEIO